jgi:ketosteroid isomerase-like protein
MSRENVELTRTAIEAWNRGDVDAVLALRHPEFEWHTSGAFPGLDPVYRGREGHEKFEHDFRATFASLRFVVEELHDGGDQVAALGTFEARGRDGMTLRRRVASVTTYRDGVAVRLDTYMDWDDGLNALGQRE